MNLSRIRVPLLLMALWLISNCLTLRVICHDLTFFGDPTKAHVVESIYETTTTADGFEAGYFESISLWGVGRGFVGVAQLKEGHRTEEFANLYCPTWETIWWPLTRPIFLSLGSIGVSLVWLALLMLVAGICWRWATTRLGASKSGAGRWRRQIWAAVALGIVVTTIGVWSSGKVRYYGGQDYETKGKADLSARADRAMLVRFGLFGIGFIQNAKGSVPLKELLE